MTRSLQIILLVFVVGSLLVLGWQIDFEHTLNPGYLADLIQSLDPGGPLLLMISMATVG